MVHGSDSRPDWKRRQYVTGVRVNPIRKGGSDNIPLQGEVISRRERKRCRTDKEKNDDEKTQITTGASDVLNRNQAGRLQWLQDALLLAGRGKLEVGTVCSMVARPAFIEGMSKEIGAQIKASLLANLHLFKREQQKLIQAEVCCRLPDPPRPLASPGSMFSLWFLQSFQFQLLVMSPSSSK